MGTIRYPGRLQDRVAVITGSSSGIGRAIALKFASEGAHIVCGDLKPEERDLKETPTHELILENSSSKAVFLKTDVREEQEVKALIDKAVSEFGRIDIMVNNAGIGTDNSRSGYIHEMSVDEMDLTYSINIRGVFLGCKYAATQFLKQQPREGGDRGWIINLASILGLVALNVAPTPAYSTSKGAVVQLTRQVAVDYAKDKIHCNALCPGFIRTDMTKHIDEATESGRRVVGDHPWGRLGETDEIAKAALFLASDEASFITGVILPVDGGYTAH